MKKFIFLFIAAILLACLLVGCTQYKVIFVNPYSTISTHDLNYRLKNLKKGLDADTNRVYTPSWVPYGYQYPY